MSNRKNGSCLKDVAGLLLGFIVVGGFIFVIGWSAQSPENNRIMLDVMGRRYLEGPSAVGFLVVMAMFFIWMVKS